MPKAYLILLELLLENNLEKSVTLMKKLFFTIGFLFGFFFLSTTNLYSGFYLIGYDCGVETIVCCCDDGNQRVCESSGMAFYCVPGVFGCTAGLGDCIGNPSNCAECCRPCAIAWNSKIVIEKQIVFTNKL